MKSHINLYLIVVGLFFIMISGSFLTEGISNVGLENSIVAQSILRPSSFGELWMPRFSDGAVNASGHMPLGFWIEKTCMYLFGDSYLFDKFYSVAIFVIIGLLIVRIWVLIGNTVKTGWLPLAFWLSAPIVSHSATSNLLEGPQTIFVLMSVAALMHTLKIRILASNMEASNQHKRLLYKKYYLSLIWVVVAALCMAAAFLIKGFSSLYVLLLPIIFWAVGKRGKVIYPLIDMGIIILVWGLLALIMMTTTDYAFHVVNNYVDRLFMVGRSERTVASHFYILYAFAKQMWIPVALMAVVCIVRLKNNHFLKYFIFWKYLDKLSDDDLRNTRFFYRFLFLALAGVLPIMLVLKQQDYYLITTLPLFAIAFGCIMNNIASARLYYITPVANKVLLIVAVVMVTTGVMANLSSISKYSEDQELIADLHAILPLLEEGEVVSVSPELLHDDVAADYFYRYKNIRFDSVLNHTHLIALYMNVDQLNSKIERPYELTDAQTSRYKLYQHAALSETDTETDDEMLTYEDLALDNIEDEVEHDPILHAAKIEASAYDF